MTCIAFGYGSMTSFAFGYVRLVQRGRVLGPLAKVIEKYYGLTKKRQRYCNRSR